MKTIDLSVSQLTEAPWNPNSMSPEMLEHLKANISRYGLVENLVVREVRPGCWEVLSGNQRLRAIRCLGFETVPCVVVDLDDANAKLLAQTLNQIQGEDDPGLRAELVRDILESIADEDVLSVLPESAESLKQICSLGAEDIASHLNRFEEARRHRLHHITFQVAEDQKAVIEEALKRAPKALSASTNNPNSRGIDLVSLCTHYLEVIDGVE